MGKGVALDRGDSVCVVAVVYEEPEWRQTKACLDALDVPVFYVDRKGVGSLAEAYNRGFREHAGGFEFVWFVSNVTFAPGMIPRLVGLMDGCAAIHPQFASDHAFARSGRGIAEAPFVEFTAPMVRGSVFAEFGLDENMPYWGHDLDWGHRVRNAGHTLTIDHGSRVEHAYVRDMRPNPITLQRQRNRRAADRSTRAALVAKYGPGWKRLLYAPVARRILVDCDGVLTDGRLTIDQAGNKLFKSFHTRDVRAIRELVSNGYEVVITSADDWQGTQHFATKVGALFVYDREKLPEGSYIAVGDDRWDVAMMESAAAAFAPHDADLCVLDVRGVIRLETLGGCGVMAEVARRLLE